MDYSIQSAQAALAKNHSSKYGLNSSEARQRLARYGQNVFSSSKRGQLIKNLLAPFRSAFVLILIAGAVISGLSGNGKDAVIIAVVVVVNAIIEWAQQISAASVLASLKKYNTSQVKVRRDGRVANLDSQQVVPGDVLILNQGEKVVADGRILGCQDLSVNESSLTGESLPVRKQAEKLSKSVPIYEQTNMLFSGTLVLSGRAEICVTGTGNRTALGQIAQLAESSSQQAPIYKKIKRMTTQLIVGSLAMAVGVLGIGLWRGYALVEMLRFVIALVVSVIPEGLPVTITVILLLGVKQMAKRKAFVRNLPSIETLGMVTVVATDKTGTLTKGSLEIDEIWDLDSNLSAKDSLQLWMSVSHKHQDYSHLIEKLITEHTEAKKSQHNWQEIADTPFEASRRYSAVAWQSGGKYAVVIKGAPEDIIKFCQFGPDQQAKVEAKLQQMTSSGMRVIAVAHKQSRSPINLDSFKPKNMQFEGLIGFKDELRSNSASAIEATHQAGIRVLLLTGDHASTARSISQELKLVQPHQPIAEGSKVAKSSGAKLQKMLSSSSVFARVLPEHKFKLLKELNQTEITAMTGDGINDAPALAQADVGIAMGSGTDVAKEAADIVLLDNNYATIVRAIKIGRTIYENIKKMIFYQLSTNIAEAGTVILGLLLGLPLPVTAVQILWMNLVTDTTMIIPLGLEPAEPRAMKQPPRSPKEPLISKQLLLRLLVNGVAMALVSIIVFGLYQSKGLVYAQTMTFLCLCIVQWACAINARSSLAYSWQGWGRFNYYLAAGLVVSAVLIGLAVFGPLQDYMGTVAVSLADLVFLLVPALVTLAVSDALKYISKHRVHAQTHIL